MSKAIKLNKTLCSYCGKDLGKDAKYFFRVHGRPSYFKCKRRLCKFLSFIGIYSTKKAIKKVEDQALREALLKEAKKVKDKK